MLLEDNPLNKLLTKENKFHATGVNLYNRTNDRKNGPVTLNLKSATITFDDDAIVFDIDDLEDDDWDFDNIIDMQTDHEEDDEN